jgi:Fur family iron response transcriptional regulator
MAQERPFTRVIGMLNQAGLRPTRQRLALARLLFDGANRHVTAEQLYDEAVANGVSVSLATVYNTLHRFTAAKVLREVVVEPGRSYFDTNTEEHHHFFFEDTGEIRDISSSAVAVTALPSLPQGTALSRVDVVVRLQGRPVEQK